MAQIRTAVHGQDAQATRGGREAVYSFGTRSRCPLCGSLQTRALSTAGRIQFRACRLCGRHYKEVGMVV